MNNKEAIAQLIVKKEKSFYAFAYAITQNHHDAEDAVGNAIIRALTHSEKMKNADGLYTWLCRIVNNEAYNILRLRKNYEDDNEVLESISIVKDETERSIIRMHVWETVGQLASEYRNIIWLYYGCELDIKEIHKVTGLPEGTVKTRLRRAKEILRNKFEKEGLSYGR